MGVKIREKGETKMKTTQKILALLLCGVLLFLFAGCSPAALFGQNKYLTMEYSAWTSEDGTVYAVSADGNVAKLNGENVGAFILPGGKKALVGDDDENTLSLLNMKTGKSEKVYTGTYMYLEDDIFSESMIMIVSEGEDDESIIIYDLKHGKEIVTFTEDDEDLSIAIAYDYSTETTHAFAYTRNGAVYTYVSGAKEAKKLCTLDDAKQNRLGYVSRDGKTVVFTESKKNDASSVTVKMQYGKKQTEICTRTLGEGERFSVDGSADGKLVAVAVGEKLYLVKNGKAADPVTISGLGSGRNSLGATYTDKDYLSCDSGSIDGVYLQADNAVYYCSAKGEKTKVLGDVSDYEIRNNKIYYVKNESMYAAKIKKGQISDEQKIGSNVSYVSDVSEDGKYMYYRNKDKTLFAYKFGEDSARRVASNVQYYYITPKGDEVVFHSDGKQVEGTYTDIYTLQKYVYKQDKCTTVADGVGYVNTGMEYYIDSNNFVYAEYAGKDKEGKILWDLKHYNGKKSKTVLQSVKYH